MSIWPQIERGIEKVVGRGANAANTGALTQLERDALSRRSQRSTIPRSSSSIGATVSTSAADALGVATTSWSTSSSLSLPAAGVWALLLTGRTWSLDIGGFAGDGLYTQVHAQIAHAGNTWTNPGQWLWRTSTAVEMGAVYMPLTITGAGTVSFTVTVTSTEPISGDLLDVTLAATRTS